MRRLARGAGLLAALLALTVLAVSGAGGQEKQKPTFGRPQIDAVTGPAKILDDAKVVNFDKVIYQGKIDVNPTLERIRAGTALKHKNDGSFFQNREGRVPRQKDREYYREFVMEMKGVPLPGPLRVVIGKKGEVFFTGDHYQTFTRVR
jgi:filamentous hemagglutinin